MMRSLGTPLRRFVLGHVILASLVLAFLLYGIVVLYLLPTMPYYCFMHDVLHLYCPLCGGTRAFMAALRFEFAVTVRYNPAVFVATLTFLFFDVRALVLALKNSTKPLFPRFLLPAAIVWFVGYTALRNILLFFGVDPIGDLSCFVSGHLLFGEPIVASVLLILLAISLCCALLLRRTLVAWAAVVAFLGAFLAVWIYPLWLLLAIASLLVALAVFVKKRRL